MRDAKGSSREQFRKIQSMSVYQTKIVRLTREEGIDASSVGLKNAWMWEWLKKWSEQTASKEEGEDYHQNQRFHLNKL